MGLCQLDPVQLVGFNGGSSDRYSSQHGKHGESLRVNHFEVCWSWSFGWFGVRGPPAILMKVWIDGWVWAAAGSTFLRMNRWAQPFQAQLSFFVSTVMICHSHRRSYICPAMWPCEPNVGQWIRHQISLSTGYYCWCILPIGWLSRLWLAHWNRQFVDGDWGGTSTKIHETHRSTLRDMGWYGLPIPYQGVPRRSTAVSVSSRPFLRTFQSANHSSCIGVVDQLGLRTVATHFREGSRRTKLVLSAHRSWNHMESWSPKMVGLLLYMVYYCKWLLLYPILVYGGFLK